MGVHMKDVMGVHRKTATGKALTRGGRRSQDYGCPNVRRVGVHRRWFEQKRWVSPNKGVPEQMEPKAMGVPRSKLDRNRTKRPPRIVESHVRGTHDEAHAGESPAIKNHRLAESHRMGSIQIEPRSDLGPSVAVRPTTVCP